MGKIDDKVALKEWKSYYNSLSKENHIDDLNSVERAQKLKRLEQKPVEWIRFFLSEFTLCPFAPFQIKAINRLCKKDEWNEVLSWSRDLAKSTVTFMCILYLTCTGRKKNILLISNSKDNATRLLDPYKKQFERNRLLKVYYGNLIEYGMWTAPEFSLNTGCSFRALGAGESPRGTRKDAVRPDTIIVDDYDTDEECINPLILKKKWDWYENALLPTRSISSPLLVVWCGNIIAKDCCVKRAGKMADSWDIINIRTKEGKSSWAEKNTEEMIDRVLSKLTTKAIQQEYFNNPLQSGNVFGELTWGHVPPLNQFKYLVTYGDPAYSNSRKKETSYKAVWTIGFCKGNYYVIKGYLDRVVNDEFINWYFYLRDFVNNKAPLLNFIENNTLQNPFFEQVLSPLVQEKIKQKEFLGIKGDDRRKPEKASRIEGTLEPLTRSGRLIFNEKEKGNPHMKQLKDQFELFDRKLSGPSDGPDCIEGGIFILNQIIKSLGKNAFSSGRATTNNKRM